MQINDAMTYLEYFEMIQRPLHFATSDGGVPPEDYRKLCLMVMEEANALFLQTDDFKPLLNNTL
jgi:hypothetical protein